MNFTEGNLSGNDYNFFFRTFVRFIPNRFFKKESRGWNEDRDLKAISACEIDETLIVSNGKDLFITGLTATEHPNNTIDIVQDALLFFPKNDDLLPLIRREDFVSAYLFDSDYVNVQSSRYLDVTGLSPKLLASIEDTPYTIEVTGSRNYDIEFNPGRQALIGYTWLQASWKMWFGPNFYHVVSKDKLLSFPDAYDIQELDGDIIYIQLFEKIEDSATKESQAIQGAWVKWLDYNSLVQRYP